LFYPYYTPGKNWEKIRDVYDIMLFFLKVLALAEKSKFVG